MIRILKDNMTMVIHVSRKGPLRCLAQIIPPTIQHYDPIEPTSASTNGLKPSKPIHYEMNIYQLHLEDKIR